MKEYLIKKGNHYPSGVNFSPIWKPRRIEFEFEFPEEAFYLSQKNTQLGEQWNKLSGLAFDLLGNNSARAAWRCVAGEVGAIEVCAYFHINGVFSARESNIVTFSKHANSYGYCAIETGFAGKSFNSAVDIQSLYSRNKSFCFHGEINPIIGRKQYPYFGGKGVGSQAPTDIIIKTDI